MSSSATHTFILSTFKLPLELKKALQELASQQARDLDDVMIGILDAFSLKEGRIEAFPENRNSCIHNLLIPQDIEAKLRRYAEASDTHPNIILHYALNDYFEPSKVAERRHEALKKYANKFHLRVM